MMKANIRVLKEVGSLKEAQNLLDDGWQLIDTYTVSADDFNPNVTMLVYVLGR